MSDTEGEEREGATKPRLVGLVDYSDSESESGGEREEEEEGALEREVPEDLNLELPIDSAMASLTIIDCSGEIDPDIHERGSLDADDHGDAYTQRIPESHEARSTDQVKTVSDEVDERGNESSDSDIIDAPTTSRKARKMRMVVDSSDEEEDAKWKSAAQASERKASEDADNVEANDLPNVVPDSDTTADGPSSGQKKRLQKSLALIESDSEDDGVGSRHDLRASTVNLSALNGGAGARFMSTPPSVAEEERAGSGALPNDPDDSSEFIPLREKLHKARMVVDSDSDEEEGRGSRAEPHVLPAAKPKSTRKVVIVDSSDDEVQQVSPRGEAAKPNGHHLLDSDSERDEEDECDRETVTRGDYQRRITILGGLPVAPVAPPGHSGKDWRPGDGEDAEEEMWLPAVDESDEPLAIPKALYDKLFPHQRIGVKWMWGLHQRGIGGILGDDMGLGKTIQCSVLLAGLMNTGQIKSALIVAPKSVIRGWEKELNRWLVGEVCGEASIVVLTSELSDKRREKIVRSVTKGGPSRQGAVCITSYGLITSKPHIFGSDGSGARWDYVILDEGHKIKNPSTQMNKAAHSVPTNHRLLVTGTPIQNNLRELWGLMDWACGGKLLGTHREFISTFSKPIEMGQDRMATESTVLRAHQTAEELWLTISPYLLQRSKADIESSKGNLSTAGPKGQSLPTKTELVAWVSLSPEQRRIYSEFLEGGRVTDVLMGAVSSPLAAITHLKKICAHPLLCAEQQQSQIPLEDDDGDADVQADGVSSPVKKPKPQWRLDPSISTEQLITGSRKLGVVLSLIQTLWSEGHRTLVFSQSIRMLDIVQRCIQQGVAGVGLKHNRIDGASSDMERKSCIDQFNEDPSIGVCLLSTKVGGYGITLTGADRVIVYDPSWNPAEDRQAVDRAYRIGQTRDVVVYRVITAGTVEEKMYEKQVFKDGLRKSVMDRGAKQQASSRHFTRAELRDLFTLGNEGETRALKMVEESHGTLESRLGASEHAAQRNLVEAQGVHMSMVHSLRDMGLEGLSLHDWEGNKAPEGEINEEGCDEVIPESEPDALFSPLPPSRKGKSVSATPLPPRRLIDLTESPSPTPREDGVHQIGKQTAICADCSEAAAAAGIPYCRACPCKSSDEVVAMYNHILRVAQEAEERSPVEALGCYLDCLELIDNEPALHQKIASLNQASAG